jgi:RHS repeat-associated protein
VEASTKYDECGNIVETIDPRAHSTYTAYWLSSQDNAYAFPLRSTNALGHQANATYSYKSGVVLTQTNPNALVMSMAYDDKDRMTEATKSDGWHKTIEYVESPSGSPPYAIVRQYITGQTYQEGRADLDNMGRLVKETATDPAGGDILQDRTYDTAGQLSTVTTPYRSGSTPSYSTYNTGGVASKSVTLAGGMTITQSFELNAVTATAEGRSEKQIYQEDGKVSTVLEQDVATGALTVATDYAYDALGRLIQITQGSQIRTFSYDDMGRLLAETHPENGTTIYAYDANSNLISRTDARNITTTYVYDALNRISQKSYSDGTPTVDYFYDTQPGGSPITIANPVGHLAKVATTSLGVTASNYYSYCSCSAVLQEATVIGTSTYITSYTYNFANQLTSMTYPNGKIVSYTRDQIGRETKVSSTYNGESYDYIQNAVYGGPTGEVTQISYPRDQYTPRSTDYTYSPDTLQMASMQNPAGTWNLNYHDNEDYWTQRRSQIQGIGNLHFEYDRLGRVTSYWTSEQRNDPPSNKVDISYDRYGNVTSVYDHNYPSSWNFTVDTATNRLTGRAIYGSSISYTYDAAGNNTSVGPYDAENRLKSRGTTNYLYDGNGRRFQVLGTSTVNYVYSFQGQLLVENDLTASTTSNMIYFQGQMVAIQDADPSFRLLYKDYLGSTRQVYTVTFQGGGFYTYAMNETINYEPFGGESYRALVQNPSTRYALQGKEAMGGYSYFGARYYSTQTIFNGSSLRWTSPDPVMSHLYDPQSLNRYAYVRNDPVNLVDPDGRQPRSLGPSIDGVVYTPFIYWSGVEGNSGWRYTTVPVWITLPGMGYGATVPNRLQERVDAAKAILENALGPDSITQKCKDEFFAKLPTTASPDWILGQLSKVQILDPTNDNTLVSSIIGDDAASASKVTGWSVKQLFQRGWPDQPGTLEGWSPYGSNVIYLRIGEVNAANVAHEVLHKHIGLTDPWLETFLGLTGTKGSIEISEEFKKKCLK